MARVAIKAQALSDFLSEMVQPDEKDVWRVFVDGAYSLSGYGVRVVIIAPPREKIKLALKIDSCVTNNEAEYEAVLAGIRAVREIGAPWIILYSDSQLITQQIKSFYEAKDDMMLKYLKIIKAQAESFVDWSNEQIPRNENGKADALAKMAAFLSEVSTREVLHVTRLIFYTEEETFPAPEDSWMTPLIKFIVNNELPEEKTQAQKIKRQASRVLWRASRRNSISPESNACQILVAHFFPVEIGQSSARIESYPDSNGQSRAMELNLVEEKREQAMI
ncbi:uncharacterized protein LOC142521802 [Primulina tabacum]|uniref:uncharacterized protein LOC142521802 n=1 Tax=Primulina tabacum TaxID=48773 RepID=UPI003F5A3C4D